MKLLCMIKKNKEKVLPSFTSSFIKYYEILNQCTSISKSESEKSKSLDIKYL